MPAPEPLGVKLGAAAALEVIASLTGCALGILGVKEGESTLRDFCFALRRCEH